MKHISIPIAVTVITTYLLFSFVAMDFDASTWSEDMRALCAFIIAFSGIFSSLVYINNIKE